ncbi:promotilin [Rhineura floridana]|uniref:promotilin n=1 Tax=Rhineura floridana TaxID=261503 RepID=UPI002AC87061|nr:promotilin [Rhineura floridana]
MGLIRCESQSFYETIFYFICICLEERENNEKRNVSLPLCEKEKNQAQKKSLTLQQRSDTRDFPELSEDEGQIIKLIAPVELGIHLNSRQLEKYQNILEELLTEMLPNTQNVT